MGNSNVSERLHSTASEALFSENGDIKRKLKNYETTVTATNRLLVFPPPGTESNEYPQILESFSTINNEASNKHTPPVRHGVRLIGLVVIITFAWSIHSLFFSFRLNSDSVDDSDQVKTTGSAPRSTNMHVTDIKDLIEKVSRNAVWQKDDIKEILKQWSQLDDAQLKKISRESWYQLLEFNVKKQLNQQSSLMADKGTTLGSREELLTLAKLMGLLDSPNVQTPGNSGKSKYDKLLAELTTELKAAENISREISRSTDNEKELYERLRLKYAAIKPESSRSNSGKTGIASTSSENDNASTEHSQPKGVVIKPISLQEISTIVSRYKSAYEEGNLVLLADIFGAKVKNSNAFRTIQSNFQSTFENTTNRALHFYEMNTQLSGEVAVITTKFNSSVDFRNGKGTQFTVADMKLSLSKTTAGLQIDQIEISNRNVNVVDTSRDRSTSSNGMITSLDNKVDLPTAAELQDITTQLVSNYESGNLEQFLALFSPEIKTNDRIDLSGVRQDYEKLFASTSDRQMFIQNLKWSNESVGAKGTGDLEVVILSDNGNTVYSMEGKIQIIAQKLDNKVKITHLYHIERAK